MTRFLWGDRLWNAITNAVKTAHCTRAAIAYVTRTLPLELKAGDVLIVDASDGAIASGQTSAAVVAALRKKGVQVYHHDGLHAKFIVADSALFASSANLSESSLSRLLEAGIETDHPNAVSGAIGLIETLAEKSTLIDAAFASRISNIKVIKHFGVGTSKARTAPSGHRDPVTWLLGLHSIDDPTNPAELKRIETGTNRAEHFLSNPKSSVAWIRSGRKNKARRGDSAVTIFRNTRKANPQSVYRHSSVLRVQPEPNCTRVFYEELPNAERQSLSWSQFRKLAKDVGMKDRISKDANRKLTDDISGALKDRWKEARRR